MSYEEIPDSVPSEESRLLEGNSDDNSNNSSSSEREGRIGVRYVAAGLLLLTVGGIAIASSRPQQLLNSNLRAATSESTAQQQQQQQFSALSTDRNWQLFEDFQNKFQRQYATEEEKQLRFRHFCAFLLSAQQRNQEERQRGGSAVHGVTKFADFTPQERDALRGFKRVTAAVATADTSAAAASSDSSSGSGTADIAATTTTAGAATAAEVVTSVDWTGVYTTAVKDQGYCGSCWAFSATEQIESDAIRLLQWSIDAPLSPQQIVSCDSDAWGCDGGDPPLAYLYVKQAGGIEENSLYPYTSYYGSTGTCDADPADYKVTVTGFHVFEGASAAAVESAMMQYVLHTGPVSVCLDASSWDSYTSGVITTCGTVVDHCVQIVGLQLTSTDDNDDNDDDDDDDDSHSSGSSGSTSAASSSNTSPITTTAAAAAAASTTSTAGSGVWKVRNSWGVDWGVDGFIYLLAGENLCDITSISTTTSPALVHSPLQSQSQ